MKMVIDGYEFEIKAKEVGKKRTSKKETLELVNYLLCTFIDAENFNKEHGYSALTDRCRRSIESIRQSREDDIRQCD